MQEKHRRYEEKREKRYVCKLCGKRKVLSRFNRFTRRDNVGIKVRFYYCKDHVISL